MNFRTLIRNIVAKLDRPGSRWIISISLPFFAKLSINRVINLHFDNGWIHEFSDGIFVDLEPRSRNIHLSDQKVLFIWGFLYTPKTGDTIIDIGAGLGSESFYYAKTIGPTGRLLSIEAHPLICGYLKRSMDLNNFYWAEVSNLAVSDESQVVFIENDTVNYLGNGISKNPITEGFPVDAMPLDKICELHNIEMVDFLKMNIEGAEGLAVRGMERILRNTRYISISCHDFRFMETGNNFFRTKAIVEKYLIEQGFELVPRLGESRELSDQVNAYNKSLVYAV